jgi:acetoacetyl-CoA synthetase
MSQASYIPSFATMRQARLAEFAEFAYAQYGGPILTHRAQQDWRALWQWSCDERGAFWSAVMDYSGVVASRGSAPPLVESGHMLDAVWFADTRLNYAENCLRAVHQGTALIAVTETGARRELSFADLREQVRRFAGALRDAGVTQNDVVGAILPNGIEAVIALLAAATIGATFTSCSPDFGLAGLLDRFGQSQPKVLWVADGYHYNGKTIALLPTLEQLITQLPSVTQVWVVPQLNPAQPPTLGFAKARSLHDVQSSRPLEFTRVAFNHPLYILYSSGTTGVPKCIVHGTGGVLLQHLKEHRLHCDLRPGERLFYFTTLGWMMWNWLVSGLASGATLVLYDGSPFYPGPETLWNLVTNEAVTIFGTSPKYLSALEKAPYSPKQWHKLDSLRLILSTGSPIAAEQYTYVAQHIGHLPLASISGGTDIVSCFALGNPWRAIYPGEIPSLGLGMAVDVVDEAGQSLIGQQGELVCRKAFPSMPVGFLNDPDRSRYRAAYFERFDNLWHHGDYAILSKHQTLQILGRSDAVLNPGGVRIGTAEIYRQVERLSEISESVAVGQQWQDDVRVVLFVRLQAGVVLDDALKQKIKQIIRDNTTPRHVPAVIAAVADIPRTRSGKISEIAVREVIHNRPVKNTEALANPDALAHFADRPELSQG